MGDPRKQSNKYSGPRHPWEATRIIEEKTILRDYGLKNKKDIWKMTSLVKNIKDRVKRINSSVGKGAEQERADLQRKLLKYNLLRDDQSLDEALNLTVHEILERRLQTQVVRQKLAKTMSQARQFIVHGHICIEGRKITSPNYQVSKEEQFKITFISNSTLADPEHPERKEPEKVEVVKEEAKKKDSELTPEEEEVAKEISAKIEDDADIDVEEIKNE